MDEDDVEELLDVVPEELTNDRNTQLKRQEKRKGNYRRRKRTPKKIHSEAFGRSFCRP